MKTASRIFSLLVLLMVFMTSHANELFIYAKSGSLEQVQRSIQAGADVNAVDQAGNTPLLLAVEFNTPEVVRVLAEAGADMGYKNPQSGKTIQMLASRNPRSSEMYALFIELNAAIRVGGQTPALAQPVNVVQHPDHEKGFDRVDRPGGFGKDPEDLLPTRRINMADEPLTGEIYSRFCKNFAYSNLRAPSTARFVNDSKPPTAFSDGFYWYNFDIDAQNGYGAMIRNTYHCIAYFEGSILKVTLLD
jgi:ankyrin repeat protein